MTFKCKVSVPAVTVEMEEPTVWKLSLLTALQPDGDNGGQSGGVTCFPASTRDLHFCTNKIHPHLQQEHCLSVSAQLYIID